MVNSRIIQINWKSLTKIYIRITLSTREKNLNMPLLLQCNECTTHIYIRTPNEIEEDSEERYKEKKRIYIGKKALVEFLSHVNLKTFFFSFKTYA